MKGPQSMSLYSSFAQSAQRMSRLVSRAAYQRSGEIGGDDAQPTLMLIACSIRACM